MIKVDITTHGLGTVSIGCNTTKEAMAIVEAVTGKLIIDYGWNEDDDRYYYASHKSVEVNITEVPVITYETHEATQEAKEAKRNAEKAA